MTRRALYIHIGPHKTGTSTIQRGLKQNKNPLEQAGYLYPEVAFIYAGQHNLVFDINDMDTYSPWLGGLPELVQFTHENDGNIILSSEAFDNIVTKAPLEKLHNAFADRFAFTIITYLRPQDEVLQSYWKTKVRFSGCPDSFETWLTPAMERLTFLEYDNWLSPFESVFGRENLKIRMYSSASDDLFFSFLTECDILNHGPFEAPKRENISSPSLVFELFRRFHVDFALDETGKAPVETARFRRVVKSVSAFLKSENIDTSLSNFTPAQLKQVRQFYSKSNQRTAKHYFERPDLFLSPSRIIPSSKNLVDCLTTEQAVRLGGILIDLERDYLISRPDKPQKES